MASKDYIPPTRPTQTLPFTYVCPLPYYSSAPKRPTACVALDSTTDLVMVPVHFRRLGSSAVEQGNHNPLVGSSNLPPATLNKSRVSGFYFFHFTELFQSLLPPLLNPFKNKQIGNLSSVPFH